MLLRSEPGTRQTGRNGARVPRHLWLCAFESAFDYSGIIVHTIHEPSWPECHDTQLLLQSIVHVQSASSISPTQAILNFLRSDWVSVLLLRSCTVRFGRRRVAGQHLLCL